MNKIRKSLDELEKEAWAPGPSMLDMPEERLETAEEMLKIPKIKETFFSLNGTWRMAADRSIEECVDSDAGFQDAVKAEIPCSVHTALFEAGRIPDPTVGLNDKIARQYCYKEWWFERTFDDPGLGGCEELQFEGVCYRVHVWLNGNYLGSHSGMFGSFHFPIAGLLKKKNRLIVKIDNAPERKKPLSDFCDNDEGWHDGVVINCVYGWHYACLPSRGIWAPVFIRRNPQGIHMERPLITSLHPGDGIFDICIKTLAGQGNVKIYGEIWPENFKGKSCSFQTEKNVAEKDVLHFTVQVPQPRLWWPNDMGEQNLYTADIYVLPENGEPQYFTSICALRKIEMGPLPGGPYPDKHNWTYIINGRKMFVKGANWCTLDVLLRFPKERYERFLTLARDQHIQLLRAWGGGMPESDDFYDLCDRLGIMVMQEWPTCWDSQKQQPYEELEETVLTHMPRLRNHPSLIMWCGGNESKKADGEAMDMMARYAYELDGSRSFHRTSPWGGALHDYSTYWDRKDIDVSLQLKSAFMGEFGMASVPNMESVKKYMPEEEWESWPPDTYGSFAHHTPRFNQFDPCDMDYLSGHAEEFSELDTMEKFVWATQIAQATAVRHTLENYRGRWPYSTGICYYKLTDVYPAASWSSVDYYGSPKLAYYVLADSFEPLHAAVLFQSTRAVNGLCVPVMLLDDAGELGEASWEIRVEAWNRELVRIRSSVYSGQGGGEIAQKAGEFTLTQEETDRRLLLITAELWKNGESVHRTFYWLNYQEEQGCLRSLPETKLCYTVGNGCVTVKNTGSVPAVGVMVESPLYSDHFLVSDNVCWLNPKEEYQFHVNQEKGIMVSAWNCGGAIEGDDCQ